MSWPKVFRLWDQLIGKDILKDEEKEITTPERISSPDPKRQSQGRGENITVTFGYGSLKEIEDIARELSTTKSNIVRLCVHEGIKMIRNDVFRFSVKEGGNQAKAGRKHENR